MHCLFCFISLKNNKLNELRIVGVGLMTDLWYPASDKGGRINLKDVIPGLPFRSNACLAKGGTILSLQGTLGSPFSKVEKLYSRCTDKLSGVSLHLQAAAKNWEGCCLSVTSVWGERGDFSSVSYFWIIRDSLYYLGWTSYRSLGRVCNTRRFNSGAGKEMPCPSCR